MLRIFTATPNPLTKVYDLVHLTPTSSSLDFKAIFKK